ncbi:MAG: diacylglycerol kinase [Helicobacteraceae bacterium]
MPKFQKNARFSVLRNFLHSLNGLLEVTKNEKPMQFELALLAVLSVLLFFLPLPLFIKFILFASLLLPIFAELINSAIERVVDLVTSDYHELAKHAKDAGSAVVLVAFIITGIIWLSAFLYVYF